VWSLFDIEDGNINEVADSSASEPRPVIDSLKLLDDSHLVTLKRSIRHEVNTASGGHNSISRCSLSSPFTEQTPKESANTWGKKAPSDRL